MQMLLYANLWRPISLFLWCAEKITGPGCLQQEIWTPSQASYAESLCYMYQHLRTAKQAFIHASVNLIVFH